MNNGSKGRCVTVTPPGNAGCRLARNRTDRPTKNPSNRKSACPDYASRNPHPQGFSQRDSPPKNRREAKEDNDERITFYFSFDIFEIIDISVRNE